MVCDLLVQNKTLHSTVQCSVLFNVNRVLNFIVLRCIEIHSETVQYLYVAKICTVWCMYSRFWSKPACQSCAAGLHRQSPPRYVLYIYSVHLTGRGQVGAGSDDERSSGKQGGESYLQSAHKHNCPRIYSSMYMYGRRIAHWRSACLIQWGHMCREYVCIERAHRELAPRCRYKQGGATRWWDAVGCAVCR